MERSPERVVADRARAARSAAGELSDLLVGVGNDVDLKVTVARPDGERTLSAVLAGVDAVQRHHRC